MIDYRTAHSIFASQSNTRIAHCIARCQDGSLYICHHEERRFRDDGLLANAFVLDQCCIYEPDDDIYARCPAIASNPNGKSILIGNQAAIFITATALSKHLGVISDHVSPRFATVHDLCAAFGVPVLTSNQYFALA
jgi:hypothetical protein